MCDYIVGDDDEIVSNLICGNVSNKKTFDTYIEYRHASNKILPRLVPVGFYGCFNQFSNSYELRFKGTGSLILEVNYPDLIVGIFRTLRYNDVNPQNRVYDFFILYTSGETVLMKKITVSYDKYTIIQPQLFMCRKYNCLRVTTECLPDSLKSMIVMRMVQSLIAETFSKKNRPFIGLQQLKPNRPNIKVCIRQCIFLDVFLLSRKYGKLQKCTSFIQMIISKFKVATSRSGNALSFSSSSKKVHRMMSMILSRVLTDHPSFLLDTHAYYARLYNTSFQRPPPLKPLLKCTDIIYQRFISNPVINVIKAPKPNVERRDPTDKRIEESWTSLNHCNVM